MASNRLFGPSGAPGTAGLLALNTAGATAAVLPALQVVPNNSTAVILNPALASSTQALVLSIPPGTLLEQRPFDVVASGYLSTGGSTTVTIILYKGNAISGDTVIGTTGAITAFNGICPWYQKATLIYDSVSGKLGGTYKAMVNNTLVAEAALATVITGINNAGASAQLPVLSFVMSVSFGTSFATNQINVQDFSVNF